MNILIRFAKIGLGTFLAFLAMNALLDIVELASPSIGSQIRSFLYKPITTLKGLVGGATGG